MNKIYYKVCYFDDNKQQYRSYVCKENENLLNSPAIPIYRLNEWTHCKFGGLAVFDNINSAIDNINSARCFTRVNEKHNLKLFECVCAYNVPLNKWKKRRNIKEKLEVWMLNQQRHQKFVQFLTEPWPEGTKLFRAVKLIKEIDHE